MRQSRKALAMANVLRATAERSRDDKAWNLWPVAYFDVPKALPIGQLCERQAQEPIQARKGLHFELVPITGDTTAEGSQLKMLHQLRKHQLALVHRSRRVSMSLSSLVVEFSWFFMRVGVVC